ncbi:hypothetical protein TPE_0628 [Treponema pedis str. T A4]|uniref:Uncharacterized protein n=1 Tax=Treponema pedis str. T A4 TaxID=1291379 RepID=S6A832_9SPIR|nr:hypothetical protein TPE_0628 [Treponema pedis str. T A4]
MLYGVFKNYKFLKLSYIKPILKIMQPIDRQVSILFYSFYPLIRIFSGLT